MKASRKLLLLTLSVTFLASCGSGGSTSSSLGPAISSEATSSAPAPTPQSEDSSPWSRQGETSQQLPTSQQTATSQETPLPASDTHSQPSWPSERVSSQAEVVDGRNEFKTALLAAIRSTLLQDRIGINLNVNADATYDGWITNSFDYSHYALKPITAKGRLSGSYSIAGGVSGLATAAGSAGIKADLSVRGSHDFTLDSADNQYDLVNRMDLNGNGYITDDRLYMDVDDGLAGLIGMVAPNFKQGAGKYYVEESPFQYAPTPVFSDWNATQIMRGFVSPTMKILEDISEFLAIERTGTSYVASITFDEALLRRIDAKFGNRADFEYGQQYSQFHFGYRYDTANVIHAIVYAMQQADIADLSSSVRFDVIQGITGISFNATGSLAKMKLGDFLPENILAQNTRMSQVAQSDVSGTVNIGIELGVTYDYRPSIPYDLGSYKKIDNIFYVPQRYSSVSYSIPDQVSIGYIKSYLTSHGFAESGIIQMSGEDYKKAQSAEFQAVGLKEYLAATKASSTKEELSEQFYCWFFDNMDQAEVFLRGNIADLYHSLDGRVKNPSMGSRNNCVWAGTQGIAVGLGWTTTA